MKQIQPIQLKKATRKKLREAEDDAMRILNDL